MNIQEELKEVSNYKACRSVIIWNPASEHRGTEGEKLRKECDMMIKWQSDKITEWPNFWMTEFPNDRISEWQNFRMTEFLNDRISECQNFRMTEFLNVIIWNPASEHRGTEGEKLRKECDMMIKWQSDKITEWQNFWMTEFPNDRISEWQNFRMTEFPNDRISECYYLESRQRA